MTSQTDSTEKCPRCEVPRAALQSGQWCPTCGYNPRYEMRITALEQEAGALMGVRDKLTEEIAALKDEDGGLVDVFLHDLLNRASRLGVDMSDCWGEDEPSEVLAQWIHGRIVERDAAIEMAEERKQHRDEIKPELDTGIVIEPKDRDAMLAKRVLARVYDDCAAKPDGTTYGLFSDVFEILRAQTLETSNCAFRAGFRAAVERARPEMRCLETMAVMSEAWINFTHGKGGDALGKLSDETKAVFEECRHKLTELRWAITMCDPQPKAPIDQEDIAKLIYEADKLIEVVMPLADSGRQVCGAGVSGQPELIRAKRANDASSATAATKRPD